MKLIVFAMIEEAQESISNLNYSKVEHKFLHYYKNENSYLLITGIGLVNASFNLTAFLMNHEINEIINIGTAGSCSKILDVKDLVLIQKTYYSAADLTGFNYKYGQIPKELEYYQDSGMIEKYQKILKDFEPKFSSLGSSDIFINDQSKFDNFVKKTDSSVEVFDMEGAALFHVVKRFNKPMIIIKFISDNLLKENSEFQFDKFLQEISTKISKILKPVLK
ncbi:5'-methylthioadenosine/S-adenosylhomocysteine nucleosidase [Spiroplasma endosymbiont of Panorpa germanica]|uniref:5'-methylthioadenosine/S-adenosylhomocysteine nucleosidase n=1 Tax=Spiroplasma endosymbiont of Panorpa germanica TaxID=3066314 RepID=UPI0030D5A3FE